MSFIDEMLRGCGSTASQLMNQAYANHLYGIQNLQNFQNVVQPMSMHPLGLACGAMGARAFNASDGSTPTPKTEHKVEEPTMADLSKDEILPDISLTRVVKWALVLIVAMALGEKIWKMFGDKITGNLHKALDSKTT